MKKISDRLLKLEAQRAAAAEAVKVVRHIVTGANEAERRAKVEALTVSTQGNVLHIIRTIVRPHHEEPAPCLA